MFSLIIRLAINAAALWAADYIVSGIEIGRDGDLGTLVIVAIIFGVVNALIKPILSFVTCAFYVLTLGLFTFIVNALMLQLTSFLVGPERFFVADFGSALLGAVVISIVSFVLSKFLGGDDRGRDDD